MSGSKGPRLIGRWRVVETLEQDDESTTYRVEDSFVAGASPARLTLWHLSTYRLPPDEAGRRRREVLREFTAVQNMGAHRLVVGPLDAFEEGDDVAVVTSDPPGVALAWRLSSGPAPDQETKLGWIGGLAEAVAHAHAQGVIHRRITPESVLVVSEEIRLTGFTHARVATEGTLRFDPSSVEGRVARYLAPEVVDPTTREITATADLFSLAAVAWTIWSGKPLPSGWQGAGAVPERPDEMPDALWSAIQPLLDVRPDHRHVTLEQLREAIAVAGRQPRELLPAAPAEYPVGALIGDRYEVESVLGSGGFATVYRTRDTTVGVERAVKVFDTRAGDEAGVRELRALEQVWHQNVQRVRNVDRTPTEPSQWYMTSDIAPGAPLTDAGPLPVHEAVAIADQLLDACTAFHPSMGDIAADHGTVHRDITPANVLYDRDKKRATLIDFNIASAAGATIVTTAGTPGYQPPDADPDRWSVDPDLFGIGVLLFELLTGEHPYADRRHPSSGVRSLTSLRAGAPVGLSAFLERATNPSRAVRFASAVEMRDALGWALSEPAGSAASDATPNGDGGAERGPTEATPVAADEPRGSSLTATEPDAVGGAVQPEPSATVPMDRTASSSSNVADRPIADGDSTGGPIMDNGGSKGIAGHQRGRIALAAGVVIAAIVIGGAAVMANDGDDSGAAERPSTTAQNPGPTTQSTSAPQTSTPSTAAPDLTSSPTTQVPDPLVAPPIGMDCPPDFPVKGNDSQSGEFIYHLPGWEYYDRTRPERCFAEPAAAEAAGYRASEVQ
jgi:serine/threonine protein kinase